MNKYIENVLNEVSEKNSNEKEFIQAVNEVINNSLKPVEPEYFRFTVSCMVDTGDLHMLFKVGKKAI